MRIQHNIPAMNSYRNYNTNANALSKNLEKLSSGYKINRAGDDAAGLAISEKMRAQITGLDAAQKNVQDGISLVKTAEGALQEVQDMLNRMTYLATQSANGTYQDEVDRENLQKEVEALKSEINRIADSSNFNGQKLLNGELSTSTTGGSNVTVTATKDGQLGVTPQAGVFSIDLTNATLTAAADGAAPTVEIFGKTLDLTELTNAGDTKSGAALAQDVADKWNAQAADDKKLHGATITASVEGNKVVFTMDKAPTEKWATPDGAAVFAGTDVNDNQGGQVTVTTVTEPVDNTQGRLYAQGTFTLDATLVADGKTLKIGDTTYTFAVGKNSQFTNAMNVIDLTDMEQADVTSKIGVAAMRLSEVAANNKNFKVGTTTTTGVITLTEKEGGVDYDEYNLAGPTAATKNDADWSGLVKTGNAVVGGGLTLQIGDTSDSYNQLNVTVNDMHTAALGIANVDISTLEGAQAAIESIKDAINSVSSTRGDLGAIQNRLEHTANNLSVMEENIQNAESAIRDTDIADEMTAYTKNNILLQSAQAMLAQANQMPQGVLQLLQ